MKSLYVKYVSMLSVACATSLLSPVVWAQSPTFDVSGQWALRYENITNPLFPTTDNRFTQHNQRLSSKLQIKTVMKWY